MDILDHLNNFGVARIKTQAEAKEALEIMEGAPRGTYKLENDDGGLSFLLVDIAREQGIILITMKSNFKIF